MLFNGGDVEGTSPLKVCVSCLCMYVLFYICVGIGFVDLERFTYEKSFEVCICL